jgi:hypothetical protein
MGTNFPILIALGEKPEGQPQEPDFNEEPVVPKYPDGYKSSSPFQISNDADLLEFAEIIKDGGNYQNAVLKNDLQLTDWESIAPVVYAGIAPPAYNGTFDGNGRAIELTKKSNDTFTNAALFYSIGPEGVVRDLVVSVDFAGKGSGLAGLAYKSYGRIERVTSRGSIEVTDNNSLIGGLVVEASGPNAVFSECASYVNITAGWHAGGIAMNFNGTMESCANYGDITGLTAIPNIGGLAANVSTYSQETVYINSYNTGILRAPTNNGGSQGVGGLFGGGAVATRFLPEDGDYYVRSPVINVFNYGAVLLQNGVAGNGAVFVGKFDGGESIFDRFENVFYLDTSGGKLTFSAASSGEDGWGTDYVKTKVTRMNAEQFSNGTLLSALNGHSSGKYSDGAAKWVQDGDYPELWVFRQDLPKPAAPSTGGDNDNGGGDTDDGDDDSGGGNTGATTTVPVAGGNVTVPSDATVNPSTGLVTLPTGGEITLTDGTTKLIVPPSTTVDPATGTITVTQSGALTLADGATKLVIPPATTINAATGEINITEGGGVTIADGVTELVVPPATTIDAKTGTMTVTQPEGGIVELPAANLEIQVPSGSNINPNTGVITLPSGMVIFPGQNGVIDTPGAARSSQSYARSAGDNDDLVFTLTSGATISPTTGIVTVRNGGEITLPDGSKRTVEPGSTINPITGAITPPRADAEGTEDNELDNRNESGSGGCETGRETGLGAFALALLGTAVVLRKRVR